MYSSFADLVEAVNNIQSTAEVPLQQDDGAMKSVNVYAKQDPKFWEQLALLANSDPAGLGELLGLDAQLVATWYSKIKQASLHAQRAKAEKQKNEMVPTGL